MLAYAPRREAKRLHPATLMLIVAGHAAALAAVMSAKMAVERHREPPIIVDTIPNPTPPKPIDPPPSNNKPTTSVFDNPIPIVPPVFDRGPIAEPNPQPLPPLGPVIGTGPDPVPIPLEPPLVRTGPRLATAADVLRPPYPASKRESGDEASLRLKLTIDERGRVVAVEPVGRADPTFLETARRHILRAWRYQPAMEGAKAVPSTTTITLKFELGNA